MFGIDSLLSTIEGLFKRIQEFFTLTKEKGVGGAIETMATNSFNEITNKVETTINSIPATLKKGSDLLDQIGSLSTQTGITAESTNGPDGNAPASTPAAPPASTPGQTVG